MDRKSTNGRSPGKKLFNRTITGRTSNNQRPLEWEADRISPLNKRNDDKRSSLRRLDSERQSAARKSFSVSRYSKRRSAEDLLEQCHSPDQHRSDKWLADRKQRDESRDIRPIKDVQLRDADKVGTWPKYKSSRDKTRPTTRDRSSQGKDSHNFSRSGKILKKRDSFDRDDKSGDRKSGDRKSGDRKSAILRPGKKRPVSSDDDRHASRLKRGKLCDTPAGAQAANVSEDCR